MSMEGIFLQVLNMSITASFIALAVIIIRLFLKKVPRWITLLLWLFVAIRLVMPFSFESALSLIPKSEVIAPNTVYSEIQGADPHLFYEDDGELPVISDDPEADTGNSQKSPSLSIPFVASLLWVAGIGGMLLYTLISYLKLKRQVAASIEVEKGLFICDNVDTPFILGVIKPRIYLPSNLTESESDYVIAHERAHLKRGDHLIKPLSFLLLSVYWFNPILWVSYILLSKDIEIACDQKVIKDMDMENKKNYSTTLLNLSIQRRLVSACPLAFGEVGVKQRIRNILSYKKPAFWIMVVSVILCIAVAVCFLTNPLSGIKTKVLDGGSELQGLSVDVLKIWGDDKGQPVIKVKFRNENDFELTCGDEFYIYKEVDGEWVNCREGEYAFTLIGYELKAKGSLTHEYGLRYVDMTASGKYRFESTATRSTGITQPESYKVWADFEIKKGVEGSGMVVHNFAMGSYVCHNSNEPIVTKPYIYLDPDGSFTSHFSGFSSTIYGGEYTAENNKLTLIEKHPDPLLPDKYIEGDRFVFNVIDEKTLQFVESESSSVGTYRYAQGEAPKAPFEDGALFEWEDENALNDSALTAEIVDIKVSDPQNNYITVKWTNNSDTDQYYRGEYCIYKFVNNEWTDCHTAEILYSDIPYRIKSHSTHNHMYSLEAFQVDEPGLYRFSSPQENIKLTFEITEEDLAVLHDNKIKMQHSSGAGAWYSSIELSEDGSFTGTHHDANQGQVSEEYPRGTIYHCEFNGNFTNIRKINDYSYSLTLENLQNEGEYHSTYIEDGVQYITSYPYGLTMREDPFSPAEEFIMYTPDTPYSELDEGVWPRKNTDSTTLGHYVLVNSKTNQAFWEYS